MLQPKIVHLNDEEVLLQMVEAIISDKFPDVAVQSFQDSNDARLRLSQSDPDILITDDIMPVPTGEDLVRWLVQRQARYPIIVTSGWPPTELWVRKYAESKPNLTFIRCPFTPEALCQQLSQHLATQPQSSDVRNHPASVRRTPSNSFPSRMEFQIGGFLGRSHKLIYTGSGALEYYFAEDHYKWTTPIILIPHRLRWEQFWRDMDELGLWEWKASYMDSVVLDGTYWCLDLDFSGRSLNSEGKESYPGSPTGSGSPTEEFLSFLRAVRRLTGLAEIQ